jgi:hypothetical protein
MEIYNEQLHDLLEPYKQHLETEAQRRDLRKKRARLRIQEDSRGCTHVRELRAVEVGSGSGSQENALLSLSLPQTLPANLQRAALGD